MTLRKIYPTATVSTTNPTWIDPVENPDLRGAKTATSRLSHGTAQTAPYNRPHSFDVHPSQSIIHISLPFDAIRICSQENTVK
jgi:hypothetical protein